MYDTVLTLEERDLFENVLESPDKNDQFLNILGNLKIESKYYTIKQSGTCFQKFNTRSFSIFNCNIRRLGKNCAGYSAVAPFMGLTAEYPATYLHVIE